MTLATSTPRNSPAASPVDLSQTSSDCVDTDGAINPDADEVCDGVDNNCDTNIDERHHRSGCPHLVCGQRQRWLWRPQQHHAGLQPTQRLCLQTALIAWTPMTPSIPMQTKSATDWTTSATPTSTKIPQSTHPHGTSTATATALGISTVHRTSCSQASLHVGNNDDYKLPRHHQPQCRRGLRWH